MSITLLELVDGGEGKCVPAKSIDIYSTGGGDRFCTGESSYK